MGGFCIFLVSLVNNFLILKLIVCSSLFTSISISKTDLEKLSSVSTNAGMLLNFRGNHLYQNVGGRRFEDKTDKARVRDSGWGWGSFFFDMDND